MSIDFTGKNIEQFCKKGTAALFSMTTTLNNDLATLTDEISDFVSFVNNDNKLEAASFLQRRYENSIVEVDGLPLLLWCFKMNHDSVIRYLLDDEITNVNCLDIDGNNAIHYACQCLNYDNEGIKVWLSKLKWVRQLVSMGCNTSQTSYEYNLSPIHNLLISISHYVEVTDTIYDIFKFLVHVSENINALTKDRCMTSLMIACELNEYRIVQCLLCKHGINLEIKNTDGMTAFIIACKKHSSSNMHDDFKTIAMTVGIIDKLITYGCNVNTVDNNLKSGFHYVAQGRFSSELVGILKYRVSDVNSKDSTGKTALHYACFHPGSANLVHELLDIGADINTIDNDGNTALHYAVTYCCRQHIFDLIENEECEILQNNKNLTPLDISAIHNTGEIIRSLLRKRVEIQEERIIIHGFKRACIQSDDESC
jgi:ankyrin repeat protein